MKTYKIVFSIACIILLFCYLVFIKADTLPDKPNEPQVKVLGKTPPTEAIPAPEMPVAQTIPEIVVEIPLEAEIEHSEPRKIVMPKKTQLPPQYKCPVHGIVDRDILIIRIEEKLYIYCNKCAMQYLVGVLELTLPKLEVIKAQESPEGKK